MGACCKTTCVSMLSIKHSTCKFSCKKIQLDNYAISLQYHAISDHLVLLGITCCFWATPLKNLRMCLGSTPTRTWIIMTRGILGYGYPSALKESLSVTCLMISCTRSLVNVATSRVKSLPPTSDSIRLLQKVCKTIPVQWSIIPPSFDSPSLVLHPASHHDHDSYEISYSYITVPCI